MKLFPDDSRFPSKLAPKFFNNILENPPCCSFVSFLILLLIPFNKISEYSKACKIFIISLISSFEILKVVFPEPCIFLSILPSIDEAAAVIPNEAKIFFASGAAAFLNGPASLLNNDPKNPPD